MGAGVHLRDLRCRKSAVRAGSSAHGGARRSKRGLETWSSEVGGRRRGGKTAQCAGGGGDRVFGGAAGGRGAAHEELYRAEQCAVGIPCGSSVDDVVERALVDPG